MKNASLGLFVFLLASCSNSNFSDRNASRQAPVQQNIPAEAETESSGSSENAEPKTGEVKKGSGSTSSPSEPISQAPSDSEELKECLLATGVDAQSVVSITQGDVDLSRITPNSVLFLDVQGQARIDLNSSEIASLKGICIAAAGRANLSLDLNATVTSLFFFARGGAFAALNFGENGSLANLSTDVSGQSRLALSGQSLPCNELKLEKAGASVVECNGSRL